MSAKDPRAELHEPFSSEGASPVDWTVATKQLEEAGVYWVSTVRPDGRPHVTPVAGLWMDDAFYFTTGPTEQKAKNLANDPRCVVTTGSNAFREGLDVVIDGEAVKMADKADLEALADAFARKYDDFFGFTVGDGGFGNGEGGTADVFRVAPKKAFAYGRGEEFTATRYRF